MLGGRRSGQNQALEQTRDSVLLYGESVGCELLNLVVRQQEDPSQAVRPGARGLCESRGTASVGSREFRGFVAPKLQLTPQNKMLDKYVQLDDIVHVETFDEARC